MENISIFLAKFWGWYFITFFLLLSFNPKRILQIVNGIKDEKFVLLIAFLAVIIGLLNISLHNVWEPNWKLSITLFGWIALLKGIALFTFPNRFLPLVEVMNIRFVQVLYIFILFLGLYLLNIVYQIVPYHF